MGRIGDCKMVKTESPIFQDLFQTVNDPFLILNTSCQIESLNDQAAQLLNINENEKPTLKLDKHSEKRWANFLQNLLRDSGGFCTLNIMVNDEVYQEIKLLGYYNNHRNLIFARLVPLDQPKVEHLYSLFNDISYGIIVSDLNGRIVDMNNIAQTLVDCAKWQVIHCPMEKVFERFTAKHESKLQYFTDLINKGQASIECQKRNSNCEETYLKFESKINYCMNLIITTVTDVTEKVILKQKVEHQNSLNSLGQMAASIAHEIRNPMTTLKGFVDLLKQISPDDGQRYIQVIDSELQRMESILTEFLYLSKPVNRHYEEVTLAEVIEEVTELMQPHALLHNVMLVFENYDIYMTKIMGNRNRIKQMLINLIKNAIEVMQNGGTITISMKILQTGNLEIAIRDEGLGIAKDDLKNLFIPFFTTKTAGTGLGLALVKKVVEEHYGKINVESTLGEGTTFIIQLPMNHEEPIYCENKEDLIGWSIIH